MGRTSKFSFPMPGRKARSPQVDELLPKPEEPKLSKVERLLGTTNLPVNNQPQHVQQLQHVLRKQASSITLTVYEPTIADASEYGSDVPDVPRIPDFAFTHDEDELSPFKSVPRSVSMHHRSSPRPSEEKRSHPRSHSSNDVPSIRHFKSQTELQTQDLINRIHSQQPMPQVKEVNHNKPAMGLHSLFPVAETTQPPTSSDPVPYPTESLPRTLSTTNSTPEKKRPTRLDFSKLLSRPSTSSANMPPNRGPISPTYATQRFPSDVNCPPELQSPGVFSSKSQRRLRKNSAGPAITPDVRPKTAVDPREKRTRRRQEPTRNSKHWFDGLLEAEDDVDLDFEAESPPREEVTLPKTEPIRNVSAPMGLSIRMVDHSSPAQQPQRSQPVIHAPKVQRTSWQGNYARSLHASVVFDAPSQRASMNTAHQSITSDCPIASPTPIREAISVEPVVESSDVEDEDDNYGIDMRDIRASIALSEVDDEEAVTFGEALAFHVRPQRTVETTPIETVEVKKLLRFSQSHLDMNQSSSPPGSSVDSSTMVEDGASGGYEPSIADTIRTDTFSSRPNSMSDRAPSIKTIATHRSDARPRLMAVTEEEEALLEMMRQKRADMASHSFAEGWHSALQSGPQSPTQVNQVNSSATVQKDTPSTAIVTTSASVVHQQRVPAPVAINCRSEVLNILEQRRGSEPTVQPIRPRHHKLHSASTLQTIHAHKTSHREPIHHHTSSTDPIFIRLSTISMSPVLANDSLSTSPSEKSGLSGLPSPVTPHASHHHEDIRVQVAGSTSSNNSSTNVADYADAVYDTPKAIQIVKRPHHRHYASMENTTPVYQRYEDDRHLLRQDELQAKHGKSDLAYATHYSQDSQVLPTVELDNNKNQTSLQHQPGHVHSRGCCGTSNVRCSVADDVMAAWSSLGGWQENPHYRMY